MEYRIPAESILAQQRMFGLWRMQQFQERIRQLPREKWYEIVPDAAGLLEDALEELGVAEEELKLQTASLASAEARLLEAGRSYEHLFRLAPDPMLATDPVGCIENLNDAAEELLGKRRDFLFGKPLVVHVVEGDRREFRSLLRELEAPGLVKGMRTRLLRAFGSSVPVELRVRSIEGTDGAPRLLCWSVRELAVPAEIEASEMA